MELATGLTVDDTELRAFCRGSTGSSACRTAGDLSPYFRDDVVATARVLSDAA
jgi:hypothetical protein